MLIGYARVSTQEKNLDLQIIALQEAGCKKIFTFTKHNSLTTTKILDLGVLFSKKALTPKNS